MNLATRIQDILLKPRQAWAAIEAEPTDTATLYKSFLLPLAAIPALASFVGHSLVGVGAFGFSYRVPLVSGLVQMVVMYAISLAMIFVMALVVDALAPTFGGTRNRGQALKLVAYGSTAAFVGGIFSLIPALSMLGLLAALYSLYLVYLGLPVLMRCPEDKAVGYTAVVAVLGVVCGLVVGAIVGQASTGGLYRPGRYGLGESGTLQVNTPEGRVTVDTARLQAAAKQLEAVAQRQAAQAEAATAQAAAAVEAQGQAQPAQVAALGAVPATQLRPFLPEALGEFKRESIESMGDGQAMPSMATATYRHEARSIDLSIMDVGGGTLGAAAVMWAAMNLDRDTPTQTERVYHDGQRAIHEQVQKDGSRAQYQVVLSNGTMLGAEGHQVDVATLKKALASIDAAKLEGLPRPAK